MRSNASARQGFTLIELLVVISIIAILAGMLIPAIGMVQANAKYQKSGKNMSGIVTALIQYTSDEGAWPAAGSGTTAPEFAMVSTNAELHQATVGAFYVLRYSYPSDISNKLFALPGEKGPKGKPVPTRATDILEWGWQSYKIPYAFDWSASTTPGSNRILIGDRSHKNIDNKKCVVVGGDASVKKYDIVHQAPVGNATRDQTQPTANNATLKTAWVEGDGVDDDNIWDDNLDDQDDSGTTGAYFPMDAGSGHPTRCFLK